VTFPRFSQDIHLRVCGLEADNRAVSEPLFAADMGNPAKAWQLVFEIKC
jgi:hypothetical protein